MDSSQKTYNVWTYMIVTTRSYIEEYNRSEEYHRSERCGSTSTQLVQLSTPSNIPGVSMVRNTGDSEDH